MSDFTSLSGTGRTEKVSVCCDAPLNYKMSNLDSWPVCSKCGAGRWPDGVSYHYVYYPSEYERGLERRIEELEKRIASKI